jgi:CBS domain-containing membrane protein
MLNNLTYLLGVESQSVSHKERIISGIGAFLGIFFVYLTCQHFIGDPGSIFILASMGSSAVLLFAVPHGALSQPWALLGGHVLSALIGVTCVQLIENQLLAASAAVGIAVTVMHYTRCTHPPGGATALGAVLGGPVVHDLGYQFVVTPVLLNTMIILFVAVTFNALFKWRRYPVSLKSPTDKANKETHKKKRKTLPSITHEDFVYALSQIDTFIDVDESDLLRIYELATHQEQDAVQGDLQIKLNSCYSNGEYGNQWSVRQIIEIINDSNEEGEVLKYKIVAGQGRRKSASTTLEHFTNWARYEVYRDEDNWRKIDSTT